MDVLEVAPSQVSALEATPATVSGKNFWNRVRVSLNNSSAPEISRGWRFTIPGTAVVDRPAIRVDESTLTIVVPEGLPVGQHDLTVTSPSGDTDGLDDALTVVASDVGSGGTGGASTGGAAGSAGVGLSTLGGGGAVGGSPAAGGALAGGGMAGNDGGGAPAGAAGAGGAAATLGGAGGNPTTSGGVAGAAGDEAGGAAGAVGPGVGGDAGTAGMDGSAGAGAGGVAGQLDGSGGSAGALGVVTFEPPVVIEAVANAGAFEDDPTVTADLLELVFNTDRDTTSYNDDSLWVSTRATPSDPWGPPHAVAELNTSGYQDTTPGIEGDGLTIWFASTRPGGVGQYDLYKSTRPDRTSAWTVPAAVTELNTMSQEVAPQVTQSGLLMVAETDRPGGAGGHDLYQTTRATVNDPWGTLEPIPGVNTASNEYAGRFVLGGLGIVFCSDRNRLNGQDIYYAERASLSEPFSTAQPLGGVNTAGDDFDPWPSEDLRYIVFASDRSGNAEIYEAWR